MKCVFPDADGAKMKNPFLCAIEVFFSFEKKFLPFEKMRGVLTSNVPKWMSLIYVYVRAFHTCSQSTFRLLFHIQAIKKSPFVNFCLITCDFRTADLFFDCSKNTSMY